MNTLTYGNKAVKVKTTNTKQFVFVSKGNISSDTFIFDTFTDSQGSHTMSKYVPEKTFTATKASFFIDKDNGNNVTFAVYDLNGKSLYNIGNGSTATPTEVSLKSTNNTTIQAWKYEFPISFNFEKDTEYMIFIGQVYVSSYNKVVYSNKKDVTYKTTDQEWKPWGQNDLDMSNVSELPNHNKIYFIIE